ncbi:MAG TPA: M56 family metallopeptidase, partial [Thermoanaerobaculia bacterium]|nr:M56 family metallopeptidase [Thermoanaerobaculia bacterium]
MTDAVRRFAGSAFPALVSHVWSSTIFIGLVLLVLFLARKRLTAGARFSLAFIGILKFAIPVAVVEPFVRRVAEEIFGSGARGRFEIPLQVLGGAFQLEALSTSQSVWPAVGIALWLAVAVLLIVRHTLARRRLVSLSVRTAVAPHPREVEALSRARQRVRLRRGIDIARAALPEAPAVLRILRPLVVLPAAGCDDLTDDELESLLCHECAHVARHDNLVARIESVICALFWFHPLIWVAQRVTVIERERACDEVVAETADGRETYLAALTKFCHAAIAPRLPGVSCMATANLKERMDHVMNYPVLRAQAPSAPRVTVLGGAALVLFTLAASLVGSDPALAGGSRKGSEPYAIK